jgi:uncharacterized heparinase superfamily protein
MNLGQTLPHRLIPGIDRMFPALRFFRHSNGELALFNGATAISADRLMCVLRYDESTGRTFRAAPHMQYHRLECGATVIIADTGRPPPGVLSSKAHAGCLSLEMSSGRNRFIVNSGVPISGGADHGRLSRSTAAHSTVVLNDTSSSRQSQSAFLGPILVAGARSVRAERADTDDGAQGFLARHDGYLSRFGLHHEREVRLSADGEVITGRDRLLRSGDRDPNPDDRSVAVARFHLHPKISAAQTSSGSIVMTAQDGECWLFECKDAAPELAESIFLADLSGPRRTRQITVTFAVADTPEVQWRMVRQG